MLGIGFWEMLVICGLILVAVGPDRLPQMVKTVAKFYRQFRRTAEDLRSSTGIDDILRDEELKELAELRKQKLQLLSSPGGAKPMAKAPVAAPAGKPLAGAVGQPPAKATEPSTSPPVAPAKLGDVPVSAGADPGHARPGQAIPRTRAAVVRGGLDDKERAIEVPAEGVDVYELRRTEPALSDDEIRLRKQRIAAKTAGKSLEEIIAEEAATAAAAARATSGAGAS